MPFCALRICIPISGEATSPYEIRMTFLNSKSWTEELFHQCRNVDLSSMAYPVHLRSTHCVCAEKSSTDWTDVLGFSHLRRSALAEQQVGQTGPQRQAKQDAVLTPLLPLDFSSASPATWMWLGLLNSMVGPIDSQISCATSLAQDWCAT